MAQMVDAFRPMSDNVCTHLTGSPVLFCNAVCISREKHIFRVKIEDDNSKKTLLDNAKNLKNSPFTDVFINRDLTHKQRGELKARGTQRLANGANLPAQPSSEMLVSPPNSFATEKYW